MKTQTIAQLITAIALASTTMSTNLAVAEGTSDGFNRGQIYADLELRSPILWDFGGGLNAGYMLSDSFGLELNYSTGTNFSENGNATYTGIRARQFLGKNFFVSAGPSMRKYIGTQTIREYNGPDTMISESYRADTLGLDVSGGWVRPFPNGIYLQCDFAYGYLPVSMISKTKLENSAATEAELSSAEGSAKSRIMKPTGWAGKFHVGYRW